ncbi:MAG: winged helix-turn-helix domain-containing protein [Pseudomonadota bacterium]
MIYRCSDLVVDTDQMIARKAGELLPLKSRAFAVLAVLVANRNRIVSKDDLIETAWEGRIVSDAALAGTVRDIRKTLGDEDPNTGYIRTIYGRGFRFVDVDDGPDEASGEDAAAIPRYIGASDIEAMRPLLGIYHSFYRTPSWPNAIKCGVTILTESAGRVLVKTSERGQDDQAGIEQRARYRGFAELIGDRIYVTEQNTQPPHGVCLLVLDAPHSYQPGVLAGLMVGSSWRVRGAPYATRVVWRKVAGNQCVREALRQSGPYPNDSADIDPAIRESLQDDCLTFTDTGTVL